MPLRVAAAFRQSDPAMTVPMSGVMLPRHMGTSRMLMTSAVIVLPAGGWCSGGM